jgi:hypothetical protein
MKLITSARGDPRRQKMAVGLTLQEITMRKAILIATAAALVAMAPQLASATPASNGAAIHSGTTVAEPATFYRRDYDYYPRHRYYGHGYYPRYRSYRYYDYDSYYPRRYYYQRNYYRPHYQHYYRRYWY